MIARDLNAIWEMSNKVHISTIAASARKIVYAAIAAVNEELPRQKRIETEYPTPFAGPDSELDSLRLINQVVHVEDGIERDFNLLVSLTDSPDLFDAGPIDGDACL